MASTNRKLLKVARQIVTEFNEAEKSRGTPIRTEFPDPANPSKNVKNYFGVRVSLLRDLDSALKAEASYAP